MKTMKKIMVPFFALAMMLGVFFASETEINAAVKAPKFVKQEISTFVATKGSNFTYSLSIENLAVGAKVTKVKSSNKQILTVSYNKNGIPNCIYYYPKKAGKATISCTIKQGGKTYKLKKTIVVKSGNPFKYVKIDGKNIYKHKGKNNSVTYNSKKKKVKFTYKLNKGWKIKSAYYRNYDGYAADLVFPVKRGKVKSGDKIKIHTGNNISYTSVVLDVKNSKGDIYRYLITLNYKK